ncbi:hypothetical protein [Qipengyuania marisflavi]|uniref:hypothetical protein n=1 Tax=Qipengyuania marisflavi TaxID=2486356 RepID=UPI001486C5D3|nr:hypothetical protein [Qipengyuania marisflavi]
MPLWLELVVLMLAAYGVGMGLGWVLWGRTPGTADTETPEKSGVPDELRKDSK